MAAAVAKNGYDSDMTKLMQIMVWAFAAVILAVGLGRSWGQAADARAGNGNGQIQGAVVGNDAFAAGKVLQEPHEKAAMIQLDAAGG